MPKLSKADQGAKVTITEARRQKECSLARLREMQTQRLEGTLISRDDAVRVWSELFGRLRERILVIPERVAPRVAAMTSEPEIRALLRREFGEALSVLSTDAI